MVLLISLCKFDERNIPDAFKHVPDLFEGPRDRNVGFRGPGPENGVQGLRTKFSIRGRGRAMLIQVGYQHFTGDMT